MHVDYIILGSIAAIGAAGGWFLVLQAKKSKRTHAICEGESTIILTRHESTWLLDLLKNPPLMDEKLKAIVAEYQSRKTDGADSAFEWNKDAVPHESRKCSDPLSPAILEQMKALHQKIAALQREMRAEFSDVKNQLDGMGQK